MNINSIFKALGVSKLKAAWTLLTKGIDGLLELVAVAFTALLRKADAEKLKQYAELSENISKLINCIIDLFVKNDTSKKAGMSTALCFQTFAKHIADGNYTKEELEGDIDCIEICVELWKKAA